MLRCVPLVTIIHRSDTYRHAGAGIVGFIGLLLHLLQRLAILDRHDLDETRAVTFPVLENRGRPGATRELMVFLDQHP